MMYFTSIVVDCGTLTNPANSQVSYTGRTTFGQTATYSCNTGYNLVGSSTHTCQGVWSGSAPTCQGVLLSLVLFTGGKYLVLFIHPYEFEVKYHTVCVYAQVAQYVRHHVGT